MQQGTKRGLVMALLGLSVVYSLDSLAQAQDEAPLSCTLYVNDLKSEDASAWQQKGFRLEEKPEIATQDPLITGKLLNDKQFALIRTAERSEFWMSISHGQTMPGWEPIRMQAPAPGQEIGESYACRHLNSNMDFMREGRQGTINLNRIVQGKPHWGTRGDAILDAEQVFYVHTGNMRYRWGDAKTKYRELLAKVKPLAEKSKTDFSGAWAEVRKTVFGASEFNLSYCRDTSSMMAAIVDKCTNCVGETYLLTALFLDAGFQAPADWVLAAQLFQDHIRPVLYNEKTKQTQDLVNGGEGKAKAAIVNIEQIFIQLWRGHSALRLQSEIRAHMQNPAMQPRYLFRAESCREDLLAARAETQASSWQNAQACDRFSQTPPPARASNENKTNPSAFDEDTAPKNAAGVADNKENPANKDGEDAGEGNSLLSGPIARSHLFSRTSRRAWLGTNEDTTHFMLDEFKKKLTENSTFATLAPSEANALNVLFETKRVTTELAARFSLKQLIQDMGFGHFVTSNLFVENVAMDRGDDRSWAWNDWVWPARVSLMRSGPEDDCLYFYEMKSQVARPLFCINPFSLHSTPLFYVLDEGLYKELTTINSGRKIKLILEAMEKKNQMVVQNYLNRPLSNTSASRLIEEMAQPENRQAILQLGRNLYVMNGVIENLLRWTSQTSFYGSSDDSRRVPRIPHPLREAMLSLLKVGNLREVHQVLRNRLDLLQANPVEMLKALEKMSTQDQDTLMASLQSTWSAWNSLQALSIFASRVLPPQDMKKDDRYPQLTSFYERLLLDVLTHPQFFFTVKPEANETATSSTGSGQMSIHQIRTTPLSRSQSQTLPEIRLPQVQGSGVCKNQSGGVIQDPQTGMYIECPEQDVKPAGSADTPASISALRDPRTEVHLKVQTWKRLIEKSGNLLYESGPKILFHHAYRQALGKMMLTLDVGWRQQIMVFDHVDLPGQTLRLVRNAREVAFEAANRCAMDRRRCQPEQVFKSTLIGKRVSDAEYYGPLFQEAFFKIAVQEVLTQLKAGYIRVEPRYINSPAEVAQTLRQYIPQNAENPLRPGVVLPQFYVAPNRTIYGALMQMGTSLNILPFRSPEVAQQMRDFKVEEFAKGVTRIENGQFIYREDPQAARFFEPFRAANQQQRKDGLFLVRRGGLLGVAADNVVISGTTGLPTDADILQFILMKER